MNALETVRSRINLEGNKAKRFVEERTLVGERSLVGKKLRNYGVYLPQIEIPPQNYQRLYSLSIMTLMKIYLKGALNANYLMQL